MSGTRAKEARFNFYLKVFANFAIILSTIPLQELYGYRILRLATDVILCSSAMVQSCSTFSTHSLSFQSLSPRFP